MEASLPQLRYLLYWAPTSMPELLRLTSRCNGRFRGDRSKQMPAALFRHPLVAFYVGQCLRCFPADDIVFYLPQLVQALREDSHGVMTQFLFDTSQRLVQVSHQLMWLLATESVVDEEEEHGKKKKKKKQPPVPPELLGHGFQVRACFVVLCRRVVLGVAVAIALLTCLYYSARGLASMPCPTWPRLWQHVSKTPSHPLHCACSSESSLSLIRCVPQPNPPLQLLSHAPTPRLTAGCAAR